MTNKTSNFILILLFSFGFLIFLPSFEAKAEDSAFRSTEYPLPRFVSLRSDKVHVRTGPGQKYPIKWLFKKSGLPVEIVLEYEVWRKIKDHEGGYGWVHQSLLSGKRTGIIQADDLVSVFQKPGKTSRVVAYIESGAVGGLDICKNNWCKIEASGYRGWVERKYIWGIYENENFD